MPHVVPNYGGKFHICHGPKCHIGTAYTAFARIYSKTYPYTEYIDIFKLLHGLDVLSLGDWHNVPLDEGSKTLQFLYIKNPHTKPIYFFLLLIIMR